MLSFQLFVLFNRSFVFLLHIMAFLVSLMYLYSHKLPVKCSYICNYFKSALSLSIHPSFLLNVTRYYASKVVPDNWKTCLEFNKNSDPEFQKSIIRDMVVLDDFLSNDDELSILEEVEPYLKRLRYEFDHWDDAIHGYRETERQNWSATNTAILKRVRDIAFPPGIPQLCLVHVLDLEENGIIKPHIDSVRFCGNTIAGLSLLSSCVMRLIHHEIKDQCVDVLLKRRSLYIMKDTARYNFTHEILGNDCSIFKNKIVCKTRRVSVIFRNEPSNSSSVLSSN